MSWRTSLPQPNFVETPIAVLGIDLGKNSCSVARLDASGAVVYRRRMTRDSIIAFTATLPSCIPEFKLQVDPTGSSAIFHATSALFRHADHGGKGGLS